MKRYVLLAGVNGAEKSTLFSLISSLSEIEKINLDETVREIGDWRDNKAVVQAGKIVITRINKYFDEGVSFSQETTGSYGMLISAVHSEEGTEKLNLIMLDNRISTGAKMY